MSKHVVDPDLGVIAVDFRSGKAEGSEPDAVLDVFEVVDQVMVIRRRYMVELEKEDRQAEYREYEVLRRWAKEHLPLGKDEKAPPTAVIERIMEHVRQEVVRLKKDEAGSSPPS